VRVVTGGPPVAESDRFVARRDHHQLFRKGDPAPIGRWPVPAGAGWHLVQSGWALAEASGRHLARSGTILAMGAVPVGALLFAVLLVITAVCAWPEAPRRVAAFDTLVMARVMVTRAEYLRVSDATDARVGGEEEPP